MNTLTLDELIEALQTLRKTDEHGSLPVCLTADYGDYTHTEQALPIRGIGIGFHTDSAYSNSQRKCVESEEGEGWSGGDYTSLTEVAKDNEWEPAVILRSVASWDDGDLLDWEGN